MESLNIKKKFKRILYNIVREHIKKQITGNLGKVIEEEEKLICYVNKRKCKNSKYHCAIFCHGINESEEVIKKLGLNKPICYVIDGFSLDKKAAKIYGYEGSEIVVKNCEFNDSLFVLSDKCILENSVIKSYYSRLSIKANELVLKNMNIKHTFSSPAMDLTFYIGADEKMDIIDSHIGESRTDIDVSIYSGNELNLTNSKIEGYQVDFRSKNINADNNSLISAIEKVEIKTESLDELNVTSPKIIYNGNIIPNKDKSILLKKVNDPVKEKRLEFVKTLKEIKKKCDEIKTAELNQYVDNLNNQQVAKIIKR